MAMLNRTPKTELKECPLCRETKPLARFFTQDASAVCRRCQIGLFHEDMQRTVERYPSDALTRGYVYVFYSSLMGLHKIGKSINPNSRKSGLSIPNVEIVFTFYTGQMSAHETLLHRIYQPQRVGGEWFKLHENHISEIKYIGWKLGIVIDSPEGFDWEGMIHEQGKIEKKHRAELRKAKRAKDAILIAAYKAYRAQFRRRCPNCLRLFRFKKESPHKFCTRTCRDQFKNSKRIQGAYLNDPDNMVIAIVDAQNQVAQYDYDETEAGAKAYRNATKQLDTLESIRSELDEMANRAYDLMSKD